jgi:phospholipid-binding lipoprotein MlaA
MDPAMKRSSLLSVLLLSCVLSGVLVGCASDPKAGEGKIASDTRHDPLEPVNRVIFDTNDFFDRLLFKPLAELYRFVTPRFFRDRMGNLFENMNEPVVAANSLLQGRFSDAGEALGRLAINSTLGFAGTFDVADEGMGLAPVDADFGQTLHSWGLGQGPYLVLPLFGPSTLRDGIGLGVDSMASPWGYAAKAGPSIASDTFKYSKIGVGALVKREKFLDQTDKLREGSIDFYAQMRSLYLQYRNGQLGMKPNLPTADSYDQ